MTDLQRFKELYLSFGITLQEEPAIGSRRKPNDVVIWLEQGEVPQFIGYYGFVSGVYFDAQGKFIEQGFWE